MFRLNIFIGVKVKEFVNYKKNYINFLLIKM